jgi:hypothetical protein
MVISAFRISIPTEYRFDTVFDIRLSDDLAVTSSCNNTPPSRIARIERVGRRSSDLQKIVT